MEFIIDFILHIDQHMVEMVRDYHGWTYAILFLIIFCETGLVVTPFLPGDSLLFVGGAIAAQPNMPLNVHILALILFAAAVLGDSSNYAIGHFFGKKLFSNPNSKIFKQSYLDKTHEFYRKYGGKTIILARFVPVCARLPRSWPAWDGCTTPTSCSTTSRAACSGWPRSSMQAISSATSPSSRTT